MGKILQCVGKPPPKANNPGAISTLKTWHRILLSSTYIVIYPENVLNTLPIFLFRFNKGLDTPHPEAIRIQTKSHVNSTDIWAELVEQVWRVLNAYKYEFILFQLEITYSRTDIIPQTEL